MNRCTPVPNPYWTNAIKPVMWKADWSKGWVRRVPRRAP